MTNADPIVCVFAGDAYLSPVADQWLPRQPAWGSASMEAPRAAADVLAAFESASAAFNDGLPFEVILDDAAALPASTSHTSRVRWLAATPSRKALVVYLRGRPKALHYAVCHEIGHNLLYARGLTRLRAPSLATPETIALVSQVSTSTAHPLVAQALESLGLPILGHEARRGERFLRSLLSRRSRLAPAQAALIAAEFTTTLGLGWLRGAQRALESFDPRAAHLAHDLYPLIEQCSHGVAQTEDARRWIIHELTGAPGVAGVNPLQRAPGPRPRQAPTPAKAGTWRLSPPTAGSQPVPGKT